MNKSRSLPNWELFNKMNKTKSKMIKSVKKKKYIPKNDSDDLNPKYLFQGVHTDLLVAIVNKQIDPVAIANKELINRGLDTTGKWVGFEK